MKILKRFRDWWSKSNPEPDSEPQEVWQWQLNCTGRGFPPNQMPQNFGLLIGTEADAEACLEASVSLPSYTVEKTVRVFGIRTYEFTDPETERHTPDFMMQTGAIRCVSRDLQLIRQWSGAPFPPEANAPFLVEEKPNPHLNDFAFHPITPEAHFITEERSDPS